MSNTMMEFDLRNITTGVDDELNWVDDSERWLFNNQEALQLVNLGLSEARKRHFAPDSDAPDLDADAVLADSI